MALTRIASWLDRPQPDRRVLVVTGSPGVGKSAVLGRVVTTADSKIRSALLAALPPGEAGVLASPGSVSCAVHAKGKTALEVAEEIARAASAALPSQPEDLAPAIRGALAERPGRRFNVIIDALDEATSPAQARVVIDAVVLPMAETCADVGVQVTLGTRRRDDQGDILGHFGPALDVLDLDDSGYFAREDLAAYALACLQLSGDERPGNPYENDDVASPVAEAIADIAAGNFLVAGLIGRTHGLHDQAAVNPARLGVTATVRTALERYLRRLAPVSGVSAADLLTALAFAEAPGLTAELWQLAVQAVCRATVSASDLARFARSAAANFLVEATGPAVSRQQGTAVPVFRLFHQALNDALLDARAGNVARTDDEGALTRAFRARGRTAGWEGVPRYLLRSLPGHARAAGMVDELLTDDDYLLNGDLRRLVEVADKASSHPARLRARLLRLTPEAVSVTAAERAAMFSITEVTDQLGTAYSTGTRPAPYQARWAAAQPRTEHAVLEARQGQVRAMCALTTAGRELLATGTGDRSVRLWDPRTGQQLAVLEGHQGPVRTVCAVTVNGRQLLASGGDDCTVRLWDPETWQQLAVLDDHEGRVETVCSVTAGGRHLLAAVGGVEPVRLWELPSGRPVAVMGGAEGWLRTVCSVTIGGRQLLATGGDFGLVSVWDPESGRELHTLPAHEERVRVVRAVTVEGRQLLATGGDDCTVRLWDPGTWRELAVLDGHEHWVGAVCTVTVAAANCWPREAATGRFGCGIPRMGVSWPSSAVIMNGSMRYVPWPAKGTSSLPPRVTTARCGCGIRTWGSG